MLPVRAQNNRIQARRLRVVYPCCVHYGDEVEFFESDVSLGQTTGGVLDFSTLLQEAHAGEVAFRTRQTDTRAYGMKHVLLMILNGCDMDAMTPASADMWNYVKVASFKHLRAQIVRCLDSPIVRPPEIMQPVEVVVVWEHGV